MHSHLEIDVRQNPLGGWQWEVLSFRRGRMDVRARGRAPYRWMARIDAWRCVRRNQAAFLAPPSRPSWLDGIDLH